MSKTTPEQNKALVLEAFDTLFNKRDYDAAARFWSDKYVHHGAHMDPGREGLFNRVRGLPDSLHSEPDLILAEGDYVIVQPIVWTSRQADDAGRPPLHSNRPAPISAFEEGRL